MATNRLSIKNAEQKKRYWILQLVGWFALMFIEIFNFTFFIQGEFSWRYFYSFGVFSVIGILSTHVYKIYFIPKSTFDQGLTKVWSKALLDVILISLLMVILGRIVALFGQYSVFKVSLTETLRILGPQFMNISRYVIVWIIIYYLYHILQRNNKLQEARLEAENRAKIAELELLKSQLNPYFLFQSLSSIKSLVLNNKEKARDGIIKLSELLRYSLNYDKSSLAIVEVELAELSKYVELEKLRLGKRFQFQQDIDDNVLQEKIPTAALINMVENAIRLGVEKQENGEVLMLRGVVKADYFLFSLYQKSSLDITESTTKGIENLKKRIEKIYGNEALLTVGRNARNEMISTLQIPKIEIK